MTQNLQQLRIDRGDRAALREPSRWPWVALIVLLLGGGAVAWQATRPQPIVVGVARAKIPEDGAVATPLDSVALDAPGYITASHKIELASKVVGRVAWVGVEMGDRVKQGQVLVRLEDDEFRARVAQQQGQLDNARARLAELKAGSRPQEVAAVAAALARSTAELDGAERNLKRLVDLRGTNAVSGQTIDDAESLVAARKAQVEADRQQLDLARAGVRQEQIDAQAGTVRQLEGALALSQIDLDNTIIRSPLDATVLERNVEVGEFVTTGFVGDRGAKGYVVSIADLNDLRVDLDISQAKFAKVFAKQPCKITTDAYPDRQYDGFVDLISPEANRQKASVQVRVKISKPDELLRPDMSAKVSFLAPASAAPATSRAADARPPIRVPSSAIRDGAVYIVIRDRAKRQPVKAGATAGNDVEILDGLIGGESVITSPPATLYDGAAVRIEGGRP